MGGYSAPNWWRMFLRQICDALNIDYASRATSESIVNAILPAVERLKQAASIPEWERELLAGQAAQEEIDQLKRDHDELEKRLREAAQPDRPEPVDPASVREGDYVRVESIEGIPGVGPEWVVQGKAGQAPTDDHLLIRTDGWVACDRGVGVWRILHAAEPVPDEAAVEALYEALRDVYPKAVWDLREAANTLAKRNVRVVNPDA